MHRITQADLIEWLLMGVEFLFRVMKCSKLIVLIVAQLCEHIKNHWIVHFEWVNSMECKLQLNKAISKKWCKGNKEVKEVVNLIFIFSLHYIFGSFRYFQQTSNISWKKKHVVVSAKTHYRCKIVAEKDWGWFHQCSLPEKTGLLADLCWDQPCVSARLGPQRRASVICTRQLPGLQWVELL